MVLAGDKKKLIERLKPEIERRVSEGEREGLIEFAELYFENFPFDELRGVDLGDLFGRVFYLWRHVQRFDSSEPVIHVFNPQLDVDGWQSGRTIVFVLSRDMPFIASSVRLELNRRNLVIHTVYSTVLYARRDDAHKLLGFTRGPKGRQTSREAIVFLEINRHGRAEERDELEAVIADILGDVRHVVDDWEGMTEGVERTIAELEHVPPQFDEELMMEAQAFLRWLLANHFTFLGSEELVVEHGGDGRAPVTSRVDGSALGLLRYRQTHGAADLETRLKAGTALSVIEFGRSGVRSRVQRRVYPEYVMVRRFDDSGRVIGEHRFLGFYTSVVYTVSPRQIPLIRSKIAEVLDRSGLDINNHDGRELLRVLETFPREELFHADNDELFDLAIAINRIQERRQIRLFCRVESNHRFVSSMVYVPRDLYHTELRLRIQSILSEAFGALESEFNTFFSESVLVRTHLVFRIDPARPLKFDINTLEQEIVLASKEWRQLLREALIDEFGDERGTLEAGRYQKAFPPGYQDDFEPRAAIADIHQIETLDSGREIAMNFYRLVEDSENTLRFRLYHKHDPMALSDVLPILENLGMRVISERPYGIQPADGPRIWIHDFSLVYGIASDIELERVRDDFQEAFYRIWCGDAESDPFNKLLLGARLNWRQVALLRAYARYMKQLRINFSEGYIAETLCQHMGLATRILRLFELRFDPDLQVDGEHRDNAEQAEHDAIVTALAKVESLSEDRVIRHFANLVRATLRTNYYQHVAGADGRAYISLKISTAAIPAAPEPRPRYEIFVYSPRLEGVHLRAGKVARGGLRWSDRYEDYRTEVLGLVKAQQVKNAVIVPVGAKGGFIARHVPQLTTREEIQAEGIECYRTFIRGLLDITDNIVEGKVAYPQRVVRKDSEDDTYLVVAADKGTATFSDIANEIAAEYNFWLGDAFASGGSEGYDHKEMGITARGAWVCVQRHFREIGIDIQKTDFTVVGIGDMAGDVFGNGMLLSEHIRLVAAFNHLHIFIDPDPDPAKSFVERKRLFELPRSSWNDYDRSLISAGGGVFSRQAKSITITTEMKQCFNIEADRLTGVELISAVLRAPVDLLFNGGIGTYVKAGSESHADVGDKANDAVRIDACELGAKVVGEGGNLGLSQLARVEYSLAGGAINTDFIDNAGGVNCSDHEVNIKILLNHLVADGDMTMKQRNRLLVEMTANVAELVLDDSYRQTRAISLAATQTEQRLGEYARFMTSLVTEGRLDRRLEYLPLDDDLQERRAKGQGLTRPELAILMAYSKGQLKEELIASHVAEDPYLSKEMESAFPDVLSRRFKRQMKRHSLRREIIATQIANDIVDTVGFTFVHRLLESTGAGIEDVVRAYIAARDIFGVHTLWEEIERLDSDMAGEAQLDMMYTITRMLRRASRWFIRNRAAGIKTHREVRVFSPRVQEVAGRFGELAVGELKADFDENQARYCEAGAPEAIARYVAGSPMLYSTLNIVEAARQTEQPLFDAAALYFRLGEELGLTRFLARVSDLRIDNHWQAMAREGFLDDIAWQQREIAVNVLKCRKQGESAEQCIDTWLGSRPAQLERWRNALSEVLTAMSGEFAMYTVVVRELVDLARAKPA